MDNSPLEKDVSRVLSLISFSIHTFNRFPVSSSSSSSSSHVSIYDSVCIIFLDATIFKVLPLSFTLG